MRRTMRHGVSVTLLALAGLSDIAAAGNWVTTEFTVPGYSRTTLWDINDSGQMVGIVSNDNGPDQAFVYQAGVVKLLTGPVGSFGSVALGISNTGVIVGGWRKTEEDPSQGFVYENGSYSAFSFPGASATLIRRISSDGRYLAGSYETATQVNLGFAFDRQTDQWVSFDANDDGLTLIQGVNVAGQVVGNAGPESSAMIYDMSAGTTTWFGGIAGNAHPQFRDINDHGMIVGHDGLNVIVGSAAAGFDTFRLPGDEVVAVRGYGNNNRGELVGFFYSLDNITRSFVASQVPEPASYGLMLLGLMLVAVKLNQQGRKAA